MPLKISIDLHVQPGSQKDSLILVSPTSFLVLLFIQKIDLIPTVRGRDFMAHKRDSLMAWTQEET